MKNIFRNSKRIFKAISEENIDLLEKSLKSGADPNKRNKDKETPIFKVIEGKSDKQIEMLRLLIEYGADLNIRNTKGQSVIHDVSSLKIAEFLFDNGADLSIKTNWGDTVLHSAYTIETAEFYISKGIDVNSKDDFGSTALFDAVFLGFDIVKLLLDNGATAELQNDEGLTPLMCLAMYENFDKEEKIESVSICKKLLNAGAKIDTRDNKGKDAYKHALKANNKPLAKYLKEKSSVLV